MKLHFVRYHEGRRELCVEASPTMVIRCTFDAGLLVARNTGYRRKMDAVAHVARVNAAAGKAIAEYAGAVELR